MTQDMFLVVVVFVYTMVRMYLILRDKNTGSIVEMHIVNDIVSTSYNIYIANKGTDKEINSIKFFNKDEKNPYTSSDFPKGFYKKTKALVRKELLDLVQVIIISLMMSSAIIILFLKYKYLTIISLLIPMILLYTGVALRLSYLKKINTVLKKIKKI